MNDQHKAIEEYLETDAAKASCDATTLGAPHSANRYMRNRIWRAVVEGIRIGRRLQKAEDAERLKKLLD